MRTHTRRVSFRTAGAILVSIVVLVLGIADWRFQDQKSASIANEGSAVITHTLAEAYGQEKTVAGDTVHCTPAGRRLQQAFDEAGLGDHADFCSRLVLWRFAAQHGHPIQPTVPLTAEQRARWPVYRGTYGQNLALMRVLRDNSWLLRLEGESLPGWLLRAKWAN